MSTDDAAVLENFSGQVRLFPLPNLVHFPHVVQGLHIFEPRYRELMADCLADDELMALVLLKPDWEADYDGRPAIENVACLGRVGPWEKLPDGRYNLRLRGIARIRILQEIHLEKPYRTARVAVIEDVTPQTVAELTQWRHRVADAVLPRFAAESQSFAQLSELFKGETPLAPLVDMLSYALPLPLEVKQRLLAEQSLAARCEMIADALHVKSAAHQRKFPPDFSMN
jgi:Lon protease-like protein